MFDEQMTIEFINKKPDSLQAEHLTFLMRTIDPTFPSITQDGFTGERWDESLIKFVDAINALHVLGYPCRLRHSLSSEETWIYSNSYAPPEITHWLNVCHIERLMEQMNES